MNRKKMRLRTKAVLLMAAFLLVTNLTLGLVLSYQARNSTIELLNERMLDNVNTAAAMLDGDALKDLTAEDKGSPEYQAAYDVLACFLENIDLYDIYTINDTGNKTFAFGIDPDPVKPGEFGEPFVYTDALYAASQGTASVDKEPYEDEWGRFYSAYTPVFDSEGKVATVVAADFTADWYDAQINKTQKTVFLGCFFFLIIGIIMVLVLTGRYNRQMEAVQESLYELADDMATLTMEQSGDIREKNRTDINTDDVQELGEHVKELSNSLKTYITHLDTQANSMITAMASDYRSVYYVDLDADDGVCYRGDPDDPRHIPEGNHFSYMEKINWLAENFVAENYREEFLRFVDPDQIREALAQQKIIAYRYLARHDGKEYYEMIRMAGVRRPEDREDHIVHAIGMGFTEIDAEMRDTMAKNEALAEALAMAEEASLAKTAFLSNMSHEIRTPMNAIIGLDNLALNDDTLQPQTREYLEKIGGSAQHLLGLINDILDMSRIESGKITLAREEFSFRDMLEQINTMVMSQCSEKGLNYECRILNRVDDSYIGDDTKLKEVLINILSNAIKFTEAPGSVTLTVERTAEYEDQSTLQFRIKDTGIGIDKEYIPKIFDAFSQEDDSRKSKYGSTGLGMAITKNLVDMMNGTIHVESEKGVGTEFTVVITLKNFEHQDPARHHNVNLFKEKKQAELAGRHILLAEDVALNAEIMIDVLDMEDIEADHAENGRIAVEMFRDSEIGAYDAILMDIRMPEMDGLEAAAAIRDMDRADAKIIPIIALTANAFDEDMQRSLQVGMNAHLTKPVEPDHLYQTLGELIYEAEEEGEL